MNRQRMLTMWLAACLAATGQARQADPVQQPGPGQDGTAAELRPVDPAWSAEPGASPRVAAAAVEAGAPAPALRVDRGENTTPLLIQRDERLKYNINLSFGWLGKPQVGTVEITSKVEPFRANLLSLEEELAEESEKATIQAVARGSYALYELTDTISSTVLPQRWPSSIYRNVQTGSENRRRELMMGMRNGEFTAQYRRDGHCGGCEDRHHYIKPKWAWQSEHHCKKCKGAPHRVWRATETRTAPADSVDMLSAVHLMRSMVQNGDDSLEFHILDRTKLWKVDIERGETGVFDLPAGKFEGVEVKLKTRPMDPDVSKDKFEGLFGIHGTISVYMHPESGVPVLIAGQVPAGPVELDVSISLSEYSGTPASFRPFGAAAGDALTRTPR